MTHRESMEVLPWYVNATLADGERRAVEEHLAECAECRQEVVELRAMQGAEIEIAESIQATVRSGGTEARIVSRSASSRRASAAWPLALKARPRA